MGESGYVNVQNPSLEGLNSGEPVEADETFWNRLKAETDKMATEHHARKRHP